MQETKTRTPAGESPTPRPPWIRLVAILAAVALVGGALFATWQSIASSDTANDAGGGTEAASEPDFSLTDEQAIATFQRLEEGVRQGLADKDPSLVMTATTSDSALADRMRDEIHRLERDGVTDETQVEQQEVEVVDSSSEEIRIREVVRIHPCFRNKNGVDITKGDAEFEQTGTWILHFEGDRWLIDEVIFEGDRVIDDKKASCAS